MDPSGEIVPRDESFDESYTPTKTELRELEEDTDELEKVPLINQRFNHRILSKKEVYSLAYAMRDARFTMSNAALFPSAAGAHLAYRIALKPNGHDHIIANIWESEGENLPKIQPLLDKAGELHTRIGTLLRQDDWAQPTQLKKLYDARAAYDEALPSHSLRINALTFLLEGSTYPEYPGLYKYAEVLEGKLATKGTSHKDLRRIIATEAGATPDELIIMAREARQAQAIYLENRDKLLLHNQRLIWGYACKIANARRYSMGTMLDAEDLWGAGQPGLLRAVERFNPDTGYTFSTFATWWIRQSVNRYLADTGATIRMPVHIQEKLSKLGKWQRLFHNDNERYPTDAETAKQFEVTEDQVRAYTTLMRNRNQFSLDSPFGDDDSDETYHNIVGDRKTPSPFEQAANGALRTSLEAVLQTLTQREQHIIRHRFGLTDTGQRYTLEEVAQGFKVTRERIRQIEAKALRKLRHPTRAKRLRSAYEQLNGLNGFGS